MHINLTKTIAVIMEVYSEDKYFTFLCELKLSIMF